MIRVKILGTRGKFQFTIDDLQLTSNKYIICGKNGEGKSSFFKFLVKELDADQYLLEIDGVDYSNLNQEQLKQRLFSYVSQDEMLLGDLTLQENVDILGINIDSNKLNEYLDLFELGSIYHSDQKVKK